MVIGLDIAVLDNSVHAVALAEGRVADLKSSLKPQDIVRWCLRSKASVVAINGPARWAPARAQQRAADRQMIDAGLTQIATPAEDEEDPHHRLYTRFQALYDSLAAVFPLYRGDESPRRAIETRAGAATVALCDPRPDLVKNYPDRAEVMRAHGVDLRKFGCTGSAFIAAFVAQAFVADATLRFGDASTGFVFVPDLRRLPRRSAQPLLAPVREPCNRCYGEGWLCEDHPYRPMLQCPECGGEGGIGVACSCNPGGQPQPGGLSIIDLTRDISRN